MKCLFFKKQILDGFCDVFFLIFLSPGDGGFGKIPSFATMNNKYGFKNTGARNVFSN